MLSVKSKSAKWLTNVRNAYVKTSNIGKLLIALSCLLLVVIVFKKAETQLSREGFSGYEQPEPFVSKSDEAAYDDFYASIYDSLLFSETKNNFEIDQVIALIKSSAVAPNPIVLDVGSGTGHHVGLLHKKGIRNVVGIDNSLAMVKQANKNYPEYVFAHKSALNPTSVTNNTFTHILCMYFTVYYFKNKSTFFNNSMNWLLPGGYLIVHLVDKDMFDPILPPGNPLTIVSPQKYAPNRITHTNIKFNNFDYFSDFMPEQDTNTCIFKETIQFKTGQKRINEHNFIMETREDIVQLAKSSGFLLHSVIDLVKCSYTNQYLYVFEKPQ